MMKFLFKACHSYKTEHSHHITFGKVLIDIMKGPHPLTGTVLTMTSDVMFLYIYIYIYIVYIYIYIYIYIYSAIANTFLNIRQYSK